MAEKLAKLFEGAPGSGDTGFNTLQIAVGGLLVKAAKTDAHYHELEEQAIRRLLGLRFNLDEQQVSALLAEVEDVLSGPHGIYSCSMAVMDELQADEREQLAEMIWDVVFADGVLHDFEKGLMLRLAPLLDIEDDRAEEIRDKAMQRAGIDTR